MGIAALRERSWTVRGEGAGTGGDEQLSNRIREDVLVVRRKVE
jgi:hypothetical protein